MGFLATKTGSGICAVASICLSLAPAIAQTATARIVSAANAFLSTLDEKQRQSAVFAFGDEKQRARWSNLPTSFVQRGGISLKEMNAAQRAAALALVSSALSPRGYEKVQQIMEGDEVNKIKEENNPIFGKDLYYISILGSPSSYVLYHSTNLLNHIISISQPSPSTQSTWWFGLYIFVRQFHCQPLEPIEGSPGFPTSSVNA